MRIQSVILGIIITFQGFTRAQTFIYKVADFFQNPIEYRNPFQLTPFEIKVGGSLLSSSAIGFDSTETSLKGFNQLQNRFIQSFEVDIAKYNLLGLALPQNFIDFQTGLGFKYSAGLVNQGLPETWIQLAPGTGEQLYFAPRLIEGNINQTVAFQWSKHFYNYFQVNAGRAYISSYRTREGDRLLKQNGWTCSVALGMKYLRKIDFNFKESYGIEFFYNFSSFDNFKDSHNISPIENLDFSGFGISLTFSMINGGNATQGDVAKELYKSGDYIAAKANFEDFIAKNREHPRLFKARWMIEKCNDLMAFQHVELARHFIEVKNYSKATQYLQMARKSHYESLMPDIDSIYQQIEQWWQTSMDSLIRINAIDQAEEFLNKTAQLKIPNTDDLKQLYMAEIYFHRGVVFTEYEIWDKALIFFDLAIKRNPQIRERIEPYLSKIAYGYINDANLAVEKKDINMALESLRQATEIRPEINFLTRDHIENLEQGLQYLREQAAVEKLRNAVDETRRIPAQTSFRPVLGTTKKQMEKEFGPPSYRKSLQTNQNQEYELWIYKTEKGGDILYYFSNDKLTKIEKHESKQF